MSGFNNQRAVIDAIFDSWNHTTVIRENDESPAGQEWIRVSIQPVDANRMNLGTAQYRYWDMLFIQIFIPADTGSGRARQIADLLNVIFRDRVSDGLTFKVPQFKTIGVDGAWFQSIFSVEFYREEF